MGLILYIVALFLRPIIITSGIVYGLFKSFHRIHWKQGFKNADNKFFVMAFSIDQYGNAVCKELFNATLIRPASRFPFGKIDQTISAVLGLNQRDEWLTGTGRFVVKALDFFDKDHCFKAIPKELRDL